MIAATLPSYGKPFDIKEVTEPDCKKGQIKIRNYASSVNPVDTIVKSGKTRLLTGLFNEPILGADFSGEVLESKSNLFQKGDRVFGFKSAVKGGAYAQKLVIDDDKVFHKPENLNYKQAAVIPLVALTSLQGLVDDGKIKKGDHVLINGCTGGVGISAVHIAKSYGCIITGVCSTHHMDYARSLGCDNIIDYQRESLPNNNKVDLFYDAAGIFSYSDVKQSIRHKGRFVSTRGGVDSISNALKACIDLISGNMKIVRVKSKNDDLAKIKQLVEEGEFELPIHKYYNLNELDDAFRKMPDSFTGKLCINIS